MPDISDPQVCYEELVRVVEEKGCRVLMRADGSIALAQAESLILAGRTVEEWFEFAKRDDCLDQMVPSDLRAIISALM